MAASRLLRAAISHNKRTASVLMETSITETLVTDNEVKTSLLLRRSHKKTKRRNRSTRCPHLAPCSRHKKIPCMCATSYPPTDYTAVLSAIQSLTTEFGMGSGVPSVLRLRTYKVFIYQIVPALKPAICWHLGGRIVDIHRSKNNKIKSSTY